MQHVNQRHAERRLAGEGAPRLPAGLAAAALAGPAKAPVETGVWAESTIDPDRFAALLKAVAAKRDRAAFATLFDHFAPRVKAYLIRLRTEPAVAEELMQEVMLTVWRRADGYDPTRAGVATWIFTIARNRRIDTARRDRRPELDPSDPALTPEPSPLADAVVLAGEWEQRIASAIGELPPEQAQMLRLAYFEDRSHSDIAALLHLPMGTVKSRLRLAIGRLRSKFENVP
ncbi:MAG: sigma-70 family RNA polymerase sigma factor [Proteobacteria bacterium]|nr:sigma-70 family RNA polymerase sigma factor [Pseudomonadota bacterium]